MDPKSEWALGEFRDAPIELRLLEHKNTGAAAAAAVAEGAVGEGSPQQRRPVGTDAASAAAGGGRRRVLPTRSAYQGERLAGVLVVKFDAGAGEHTMYIYVDTSELKKSTAYVCTAVQPAVDQAALFPGGLSLSFQWPSCADSGGRRPSSLQIDATEG